MDLKDCIYQRRSVRKFDKRQIGKEDIIKLIEAAIQAPNACNRQAWKFIWIKDKSVRRFLSFGGSPVITNAPSGILMIYRNDLSYNSHLYKDYIQSAAAAIQNMLLTAVDMGLGGCWICNLARPGKIRKKLGIPGNYDVIAYIALGYPQKDETSLSVNHYKSLEKFKAHERKYCIHQVLCEDKYQEMAYDSSKVKKKRNCSFIKYIYKLNIPFIKDIENKL